MLRGTAVCCNSAFGYRDFYLARQLDGIQHCGKILRRASRVVTFHFERRSGRLHDRKSSRFSRGVHREILLKLLFLPLFPRTFVLYSFRQVGSSPPRAYVLQCQLVKLFKRIFDFSRIFKIFFPETSEKRRLKIWRISLNPVISFSISQIVIYYLL